MADSTQPGSSRGAGSTVDDPLEFAIAVARVAAAHRAEDVVLLDLRGLSSLADSFVIGTGTSDRQMRAVLERIEEYARSVGRRPFRVAGTRDATWILADFVDVVVHLFDAEHREYYDLEGLWGDAPRVIWQDAQEGSGAAEDRLADGRPAAAEESGE